jgi:phosphate transport system protein
LILLDEPFQSGLMADLENMARCTQKMLSGALDAFRNRNTNAARDVFLQDDRVDSAKKSIFLQVEKSILKNSAQTRSGIQLLMICCNLERIGDLACNIAEDVIYMKQGKEVRHRIGIS